MNAVDTILTNEVQRLTDENDRLEIQNERLSKLLANTLDILGRFQRSAKEHLDHYSLDHKPNGNFDPDRLRNR